MFIKIAKIFIFILLIFYQNLLYSKNKDINEFNSKDLSNYFSAQVSYINQKNSDALKFFKNSKFLKDEHAPYFRYYIFSLINEGNVSEAIKELKEYSGKKNPDFFEAYFLLTIDSLKKDNFKKTNVYLKDLSKIKGKDTLELAVYETLKSFSHVFENKKIPNAQRNFGNLSLISRTFQSCYLDEKNTLSYFLSLINNAEVGHSRYKFFLVNYLVEKNRVDEAKKIINKINILNSSLLVAQTKKWIEEEKLKKFNEIFSCKNKLDILGEFFFLMANLYSSQNDFEKSNFYLNISNYLNPKFKFNLTLMAENYFDNKNYKQSEKILNNFSKDDDLFYWYKVRKKSKIIFEELGADKSFNFINKKFKKIKNPSMKIIFDMANITRGLKKYDIAIKYYNKILSKIDIGSESYAKILYRKGGSHERLGNFEQADKDLLKSLEVNPEDAYVLNYLAYSWLERDYKINTAIQMLEKAYKLKKNDAFIVDSIGWAYYLIGDFVKAEKLMKRALILMPDDPIVNDHYGDILWKLNRIVQAQYYWKSVLKSKTAEKDMKEKINIKLLKGPNKI